PSEVTQKFYSKIKAAAAAGGGDPGEGAVVFEDNCLDCHTLNGEGGEVGPDLSGISAKGLKFISESILRPAKSLTKGFETYVVIDKEGRQTIGLKTRDEAGEIDITKANGDVVTILKENIKQIKTDETKSVMPDDLAEAMTVKDYQDILSFLMLQKPKPKAEQ
ncbi:MAG TPA: c-type cytochrome, partial [Rhizobiales bacterium]|nr:c-type cytochrome [Hyphomicrobiales bacterium]